MGSKGCTAVARSTTGRSKLLLSTRRATRVFKRGRGENGIADRRGERRALIAVAVVCIIKSSSKNKWEEEWRRESSASPLFDFREDACVRDVFVRLAKKNQICLFKRGLQSKERREECEE